MKSFVIGLFGLIASMVIMALCYIPYNQKCGGHLERAASANTVELATQELETATNYLEKHDLTSGNTSSFWQTPQNDLGFWYQNLTDSLAELKSINKDTSKLEKSNVLLKLRETLMEQGKKGSSIAGPSEVYLYPHNTLLSIMGIGSLLLMAFGVIVTGIEN